MPVGRPATRFATWPPANCAGSNDQIQQMNDLRDQLRTLLEKWDGLLEHTSNNERANLLEELAASRSKESTTLPRHFYAALTREIRR